MKFSPHLLQGLCWPLKRKRYKQFQHYNGIQLHQPQNKIWIKINVYSKNEMTLFPNLHIIPNLGLYAETKNTLKWSNSLYDFYYSLMVTLSAETPSKPLSGLMISAIGPSKTLSLFNYHLEQHENCWVYSPFNLIHYIDILIKQIMCYIRWFS